MQRESFLKETKERLKTATPRYFKRLRAAAIWLTSTAAAVIGLKALPGYTMPPIVDVVCSYLLVAGVVTGLVSTAAKKCDCHD